MKRYIDATSAINLLSLFYNYTDAERFELALAISAVPTADVVERKRGKWMVCNILDFAQRPTGRKVGRCSHCGHLTDEFRTIVEASKKLTNFCSECGSYNREESEDAEEVD